MKALTKLFFCLMLLALAAPAMAAVDYRMVLPGIGNTTSFGDANFYTVSGDAQTQQNLGLDGVVSPGDTFLQNNVKLLFVSDTKNSVTENINTGQQSNKLYLSADNLTGFIDATGDYYVYNPNQAAALFWDYTDIGGFHHIKLADILLTSGIGLLDDGVTGPINSTPTGTVHLDGDFFNMLPGVFFSGATDLSSFGSIAASLRGVNNVTSNTPVIINGQPVALLLTVHDNADQTIGVVPEPASMALMGLGALGAAFLRRRAKMAN